MPPLAKAQHETFAQEMAKGRKIGEAYALAGFHPHPANPTLSFSLKNRLGAQLQKARIGAICYPMYRPADFQ
jgi:hypothetical protein